MLQKISEVPTSSGLASRLALAELERQGIEAEPLLLRSGLALTAFAQPKRVSVASQIDFLELASHATGDEWFGLKLAESFDLREMGMVYYVAASSPTLGDALRRVERYIRVGNESLVARVQGSPICRVSVSHVGISRHKDRQQIEFQLLVILRLCRQLVGNRIVPVGVSFVHHRSGDFREVRRKFSCEVQFGADVDEVRLGASSLELALAGADPFLNELMVKNCEEAIASRTPHVHAFRSVVENAIAPLLPHAEARAKVVAQRLGLSERTFARRLTAEGLTFAEILDDLRRDLTVRYLKEPGMQVSQIAWSVGFQHPSALSHACKRWFGTSPSAYRRSVNA
ncbi:AraC family transcriptional regulator [Mesorhizobium sp. CN2-181]|uniref:AraC family transcriptional regulator n=1 Tax=Mesorhizobium yinganensis TaxID=3157707 RepID=UPI0032B75D74